jgi:hypothetical protein
MSKEFFDKMVGIIEIANRIKFWEGSHPELASYSHEDVVSIYESLRSLENRIEKELRKKAKRKTASKKQAKSNNE